MTQSSQPDEHLDEGTIRKRLLKYSKNGNAKEFALNMKKLSTRQINRSKVSLTLNLF